MCGAVVALVFAWRYAPKLGVCLTPLVVLLCFGGIYDRYHYASDAGKCIAMHAAVCRMNNTAQWNGPHTLIGLADCCTTALVKDARKCREPHRFSAHAIPLSGTNSVRELIDCSRLQMLPTLAVEQRASTSTIVRYLLMFSKFLTLDTVPRPRIASSRFDSMSLPHSSH